MFVINIKDHSEKYITTHTYFINDTKDFTDLCLTANVKSDEIKYLYDWVSNANMNDTYKNNHIHIFCVNDTQARQLAKFYHMLPEFEKQYGKA